MNGISTMTNFREVLFWSIFKLAKAKILSRNFVVKLLPVRNLTHDDKCKKGSDDARLLFHSVHRITSPDARPHIFLVHTTSAHFHCGHTTLAQGKMSRTVIHTVPYSSPSVMSLLNARSVHLPRVSSSHPAQSSRPSASTKSIARSWCNSPWPNG